VTVLCGTGNNGGDGMMAARLLAHAGLDVATLLLGSPDKLTGDAAKAWQELNGPEQSESKSSTIYIVATEEDLAQREANLHADLILDAVVGTGFKPPLKGLALAAHEWLKARKGPVLAVDLPSGWPADETGARLSEPVFPADAVITFSAPKPAHVFGLLTRAWNQPVVVAPIGSPEEAIVSELNLEWAGSAMELVHSPRSATANKGNFGHVLVVGGTFGPAGGKAGAPAMTALAAMRVGAGLVTAAVPAKAMSVVSLIAPELMTWPLEATGSGCISDSNLAPGRLAQLLEDKSVLAIGPGLGRSNETANFTRELLAATRIPAVIDADALNILAENPDQLAELAKGRTVVLTPHPGEMARLAGTTVTEVQAHRLETALAFAVRHGLTVVLKGARTIVAHANGRVAVNTSGNPGMAKGGSGDLLTGLIAGMLAQFPGEAARAVEAAVYLHGLAADLAVRAGDEHTLLATHILKYLSRAFRMRVSHFRNHGGNRYVWLQGLPADASMAAASRGVLQ
jgi:NAD(P)H-hydrate epimerase